MKVAPKTVLEWIIQNPGASPREIDAALKVPRTTLNRYIKQLTDEGCIVTIGSGPSTRHFASDLRAFFSLPTPRRPLAKFVPERLTSALPRFTASQLKQMRDAAPRTGATAEETARSIRERLMLELSFASSRLEGNTYDLLETQTLIAYGRAAGGKSAEEARMILNHKDAISYLLNNILECAIDEATIKDVHSLVSNGLLADRMDEGRIRERAVSITTSTYEPLDNRYQLDEGLKQLLASINAEQEPFNRSIMLMTGIAYLQPFADCNKRTGRIMANLPLIQAGLPPLSFMTVEPSDYVRGLMAYYELGVTTIIRSAYSSAYVESAAQFDMRVAQPQKTPEQRAFDIKYLAFEKEFIRQVVRGERVPNSALPDSVPSEDRERLRGLLNELLSKLHVEQAVVYGLSKIEVSNYLAGLESQPVLMPVDNTTFEL